MCTVPYTRSFFDIWSFFYLHDVFQSQILTTTITSFPSRWDPRQSQSVCRLLVAKVHNCNEHVVALAFISGLWVTHPLYKHLVKYVTRWNEVLYRAQPYIQLEEAMKSSANQSLNRDDDGENLKHIMEAPPPSTIRVVGRALSRSVRSQTFNRAHYELTEWMIASPCWSSRTSLRANPGWSV